MFPRNSVFKKLAATMLVFAVTQALTSCETRKTIDDLTSERYYEITYASPETIEKLKASGKKYYCTERKLEDKKYTDCFVEEGILGVMKNISKFMYDLPVAVIVDTGETIMAIGGITSLGVLDMCTKSKGAGSCTKG